VHDLPVIGFMSETLPAAPRRQRVRTLLFFCVLALAAAGCGGKPDCTEAAKAWCAQAKACGGTPTPECESIVTNSCNQAAPSACAGSVDASECVSAASSESCALVLADQAPNCTLRCK
jgi:hypothetical protein